MKIIVCCKLVPEEQDITVNADRTLALSRADTKISLYDLNAVEAAAQLVAATGGKLTALSVGATRLDNPKARKDILSRGPDDLTLVTDSGLDGALPAVTATILADAAKKLEFDLILCGEGSSDLYAQQTGLLLGERLGVPTINAISRIIPGEGKVIVERTLENEVEVLDVPLPAVLSVTTDINVPKIPPVRAILGAGKKPVTQWTLADTGDMPAVPAVMQTVLAPEQKNRKKIIIEGDADDNIAAFVGHLRKALN